MEALPFYLLLGAGAGLLAGLFGIGGGLIIVPALAFYFEHRVPEMPHLMQTAVGTSLASIAVTALASLYGHQRQGAVDWTVFTRLLPGLVVGTALGVALADAVGSDVLRQGFAVFVLLVSVQMVAGSRPRAARRPPGRWAMALAGVVIGAVSAVVGIGGGTLTTPFLAWCRIGLQRAIATSAACGLPIALTGALGYTLAGEGGSIPPGGTGYVYWPAALAVASAGLFTAPLAARLTHVLPVIQLRRLFALLLVLVALRLLLHEGV